MPDELTPKWRAEIRARLEILQDIAIYAPHRGGKTWARQYNMDVRDLLDALDAADATTAELHALLATELHSLYPKSLSDGLSDRGLVYALSRAAHEYQELYAAQQQRIEALDAWQQKARAFLEAQMYEGYDYELEQVACIDCGRLRGQPHAPHCELARLLPDTTPEDE